jgi:hypothetical protein
VTTERAHSTNGHGPHQPEIYTYRPRRPRRAVGPARLLLPVLLLLAVVAVLRHFEQSTAG